MCLIWKSHSFLIRIGFYVTCNILWFFFYFCIYLVKCCYWYLYSTSFSFIGLIHVVQGFLLLLVTSNFSWTHIITLIRHIIIYFIILNTIVSANQYRQRTLIKFKDRNPQKLLDRNLKCIHTVRLRFCKLPREDKFYFT